ncbi:MAG: hypothetical protein ACC628_00875 [Pirellulaceae bacterium]
MKRFWIITSMCVMTWVIIEASCFAQRPIKFSEVIVNGSVVSQVAVPVGQKTVELDLHERRGDLMSIERFNRIAMGIAGVYQRLGEQMAAKYGDEMLKVFVAAQSVCKRIVDREFLAECGGTASARSSNDGQAATSRSRVRVNSGPNPRSMPRDPIRLVEF